MKVILKKTLFSLKDLPGLVCLLASHFKKPQALLLCGPPGAGKTTLVHECLKQNVFQKNSKFFASDQKTESIEQRNLLSIASPAYTIHNTYKLKDVLLHHIDLYRLEDDEDLESTGFWDIFEDKKNFIIIEWADRLNKKSLSLGWNYMRVELSFDEENNNARFAKAFTL